MEEGANKIGPYQYKVQEASERKPDPNHLWDGDYLACADIHAS